MKTTTEAQQRFLLVGKKWICQQIAYVLDMGDYVFVEKLTQQNWEQYRDCQIYVCEFKRKSRKYVQLDDKVQLNISYFDDIFQKIDQAYGVDCKEHPHHSDGLKALTTSTKTVKREIRNGNLKYLKKLKPSELLWYVLRAPINKNIDCTLLETNLRVRENGELKGCCSVVVPFGNWEHNGEISEIYHSTYARIVKLSSLNRSYCLCELSRTACKGHCSGRVTAPKELTPTNDGPKSVVLDFDRTCNLCCRSCRSTHYVMDDARRERADMITAKLLRSGYMDQAQKLVLAGMGEVFYSQYYRQLLTTDLQRQTISILSNGTLFNEDNWQLVAGKYSTIDVSISVDAATAGTYKKLRGADFDNLMRNLNMLGDLHCRKLIRKFSLNFVVQRDNFREMPAFVRLGKALGVDYIQFQCMKYFSPSIFTTQNLAEHSLVIDNRYLDYELWCLLQDPIFKSPTVHLQSLQRYIDASEHLYRKRYERGQRHCRFV